LVVDNVGGLFVPGADGKAQIIADNLLHVLGFQILIEGGDSLCECVKEFVVVLDHPSVALPLLFPDEGFAGLLAP
jgi:hypothetical protein